MPNQVQGGWLWAALCLVTLVNCGSAGSNSPSDASGGVQNQASAPHLRTEELTQACAAFAKAQCDSTLACNPRFLADTPVGDHENCVSVLTRDCPVYAQLPGTSFTLEPIKTCVAALSNAAPCASIPECPPLYGTLPEGAPCLDGAQCQSGSCSTSKPGCPRCDALPTNPRRDEPAVSLGEGAACPTSNGRCGDGLFCGSAGVCAPLLAIGQACTLNDAGLDSGQCVKEAYCATSFQGLAPNASGVCTAKAALGEACPYDGAEGVCRDWYADCVEKRCQKTVAAIGEACSGSVHCIGSAYCDASQRCSPRPSEGAPCNDISTCAAGLLCYDGVCTRITPTLCN